MATCTGAKVLIQVMWFLATKKVAFTDLVHIARNELQARSSFHMRRRDDDTTPDAIFGLLSLFLLVPLAAWEGWVLKTLWTWFVVPLGVPSLGLWHAVALAMMVSWLADSSAWHASLRNDDDRDALARFWARLKALVVCPLFALAMGALCHACM